MRKTFSFFLCSLLFILSSVNGKDVCVSNKVFDEEGISSGLNEHIIQSGFSFSNPLNKTAGDITQHKKHRLVAALLAFPLGVFGLHRMYLGTSAVVPIVYIVTIGGVFGVLPFIDFVLILLSKDINKTYVGNHHLFMWQKK
jgi:TM2 domain-containing membrane protein YozV